MRAGASYSFYRLLAVSGGILALWAGAYIGFIAILPLLGFGISYATHPFESTAYYLVWAGIACLCFPHTVARVQLSQSARAYGSFVLFMSAVALFYGVILSLLPGYAPATASTNFFLNTDRHFFLPKFAELLFQQILIAATILSIASFERNLLFVSLMYGVLFGFAHVFVLFEIPPAYVGILALGAVSSAALFPYLILRVENGFIYSFMIHWLFYIVLTITHLI
jgi:hypothetical protein